MKLLTAVIISFAVLAQGQVSPDNPLFPIILGKILIYSIFM